jgi:hypothetical protein
MWLTSLNYKYPDWKNHKTQFSINQILKRLNWTNNFNYTLELKKIAIKIIRIKIEI